MSCPHKSFTGSEDPITSLQSLGQGGFSSVDKVEFAKHPGPVYARKLFFLPARKKLEKIQEINNEVKVVSRLRHHHVITIVMTYEWGQFFGIIMDQVAEEDLANFLNRIDKLGNCDPVRQEARSRLRHYPSCLIHTMNFIHSQHIRHKDIKPDNILIKNGKICLTDFGLARDFSDGATSGTEEDLRRTWMYAAPEVLEPNSRKGRAADIFSLGCVFLEISEVCTGAQHCLAEFKKARQTKDMRAAFAHCPFQLAESIWWGFRKVAQAAKAAPESTPLLGARMLQLAFHMLDPNPKTRVTAAQLVATLRSPRENNFSALGELGCIECEMACRVENIDTNTCTVPEFIPLDDLIKTKPAERETPDVWDVVKDSWLQAGGGR